MAGGRREDWRNRRRDSERTDRRSAISQSPTGGNPERRKTDRRKIAQASAGMLMAALTFAGGSMKSVNRFHHGTAQGTSSGRTPAVPGLEEAADEDAQPQQTADTGTILPIYLNSAVEGALDTWNGKGRTTFSGALARGEQYLPEIRQVFVAEGVPADLAYVALVESEFKPEAQSGAAARGVWQIMPATGKHLGLAQDFWVDERSDPQKSTRAAAKYLKYLHGQFGDWDLALAAYNAGEGNVRKAIKRTGTSDYWKLSQSRALPKETRDYVPRIHAAILMAREPAKYGFDVANKGTPAPDQVTVPKATDIRAVAQCTGTDIADVLDLNPALKRRSTPLNREFVLNVPAGKGEETKRCIVQLPESERGAVQMHVVASGQTLSTLAKQYGTRAGDIAEVNNIGKGKRIAKGTELLIPKPGILQTD